MPKGRLEAFTDGVMAIIITLMVLELREPAGGGLRDLLALWPVLISYVLSFAYVGIYWNNHHHMFQAVKVVSGRVLWANLHLLFWLSLLPFCAGWIALDGLARGPVGLFGFDLLMAAAAYFLLQGGLIRQQGREGLLARAVGADCKGRVSMWLYTAGVALAAVGWPKSAFGLLWLPALLWVVPDARIERVLGERERG
ncbi:TMEM175 family protein [Acidocella sp.]|uniref:TMEM175 family protein n=1 Tax=Acidocella sp. TaxID=50710 RepID=UPI0026361552|nr:TMEM175 family protein [Acidocella sp.]